MANNLRSTHVGGSTMDDVWDQNINEPSELDELSHNEMCEIYSDAGANIRFAKDHQWRTVI